jgi:hypothetical protein
LVLAPDDAAGSPAPPVGCDGFVVVAPGRVAVALEPPVEVVVVGVDRVAVAAGVLVAPLAVLCA